MKILVTGGAGYVGSHACKALALAEHRPLVYDDLSAGRRGAVRWGALEVGDIRDGDRLERVLDGWRPDLVMHCAGRAYVGESFEDPAAYYDVNVGGSLTLLRAMMRTGVGAIVFSSSCATYGIPERLPITEDSPQAPVSPYGFTKLAVERMLLDFEQAHGLRWISLRYFNAAGADPDGELGEDHEPETHAIPLAIRAALFAKEPFRIYGTDYPTPDGSAVRDYVHVSDLARAHLLAAEHLAREGRSAAINLGVGAGVSVFEMLAAVRAATGRTAPTVQAPRRPGDPPVLFADVRLGQDLLGWRPRFALDEIVASAVRWEESRAALAGRAA